MKIAIYQVNMGRDHNRVAFLSYEALERFQGTNEIDSEIYDKVFQGDVICQSLEDVFRMFNVDQPKDYKGRSLSVSDIVEIIGTGDNESTFAFCDSIGFQKVKFDPARTEELKEEKIKVVLCEPGKRAQIVTDIVNTLAGLQTVVKGDIEAFYPFSEPVCIVCNEEGKFNGMEPCRAIYGADHEILDVIFGPFIICDCAGQNFGSLSSEQLERYRKQYDLPERLIANDGKITAVPYEPLEQERR